MTPKERDEWCCPTHADKAQQAIEKATAPLYDEISHLERYRDELLARWKASGAELAEARLLLQAWLRLRDEGRIGCGARTEAFLADDSTKVEP